MKSILYLFGVLSLPFFTRNFHKTPAPVKAVPAVSVFEKAGITDAIELRKKRLDYIKTFYLVAQAEQQKFGIPASVTLAQGMLESENGTSTLARKNKNHFGIKCFAKSCKKGHCTNHSDDSHKDFFRKYESNWASFRDHSRVLTSERYRRLIGKPAKEWVKGLKRLGYATDPAYGVKLGRLIDGYCLVEFDKQSGR